MQLHPDQLIELIRRHAFRSRESLQVAERLKNLLPQILLEVKKGKSREYRGAEAERRALIDAEYLRKIDEYLEIQSHGLEARIQYETHRMLLQAWQSMNAYHRAAKGKKSADANAAVSKQQVPSVKALLND